MRTPADTQQGDVHAAYRALTHDDERRGFLEAAMDSMDDMPDGAFFGYLAEVITGDPTAVDRAADELERLGLVE